MTGLLVLDHLAISARSLAEGATAVEAALGVPLVMGGKHPHMGTHNLLLSLGPGTYLEVIAIDPDAPRPAYPRWFALDAFDGAPRLSNWVARVPDLGAALAQAPAGSGQAVDLQRGDLSWRMAVPTTGRLPFDEAFPALIEWQGSVHPSDRLPDSGCRLTRLTLTHPNAEALAGALTMEDPRLRIAAGPEVHLSAEIATPSGPRHLP